MHRRTFLKQAAGALVWAGAPLSFAASVPSAGKPETPFDSHVKDRLLKKQQFDQVYTEDIFLDDRLLPTLKVCLARLKQLQKLVGYGNFSLLNFDEALAYSKSYSSIGQFSRQELDFLEMIFYSQVKTYGFMGEKPIKSITGKINRTAVEKIPHTGHYLYQGKPMEIYQKIEMEVGNRVILTSGVRSVMKQFLLFLNKAAASHGNLSMASRSLAPPGYSFHGVGDFDVGEKGYGIHNFTERFVQTDVYKRLVQLGYLKFRYDRDNDLGVRFEPWHIEVV